MYGKCNKMYGCLPIVIMSVALWATLFLKSALGLALAMGAIAIFAIWNE